MTPIQTTERLLCEIREVMRQNDEQTRLPQNAFYLQNDRVVCGDRSLGESRYPYDADGLVVWARSSGVIEACESTFHIFRPLYYAEDASVSFVAGLPLEDGTCDVVSVLGGGRQLRESVERYVVYGTDCAYYITDCDPLLLSVRLHVDSEKHIHLTFSAKNKTEQTQRFYLASVIEAILRFRQSEGFWEKMSKFGYEKDGSFLLRSNTDCLVINRANEGVAPISHTRTTGKHDVLGSGRLLSDAEALRDGAFVRVRKATNSTDVPVAAEMLWYELPAGDSVRLEYELSYYHDMEQAQAECGACVDMAAIDRALQEKAEQDCKCFDRLKVQFSDWHDGVAGNVAARFMRNVQKQVDFCALGKNYAGNLIGMRDVMQQLEQSLIWNPQKSREKMVTALQYILEEGRPPRQFSLPVGGAMPEMDLRMFIDQGAWILSTLYAYLAYTDDYSILQEPCSYYVVNEQNTRVVRKSDRADTVLEHVLHIMSYLISNIDPDTGCLRILFGDWNDSVDKLGKTSKAGQKYGNGVSVMASLQLYRNCKEVCEILRRVGGYEDRISRYNTVRKQLEEGLQQYAVQRSGDARRILHGWGDDRGYFVGSFCDPDGEDRISATAQSFWTICGMLEKDPSLKDDIMQAFRRLDGPYGLLTFDKPFPRDVADVVGRIANIVPGTYENAGTYVHSAMFACMAMFMMGESDYAWNEIRRAMVVTHDNCSMTPFVMPNSYCYNPEYGIDGESMGDWYTGSGTVLLKAVIKYGFGVAPDLNGVRIQTARTMPCDTATLCVTVKGHPIELHYAKAASGDTRTYYVD
ncbi:MAG: hypothetical protein IJP14_00745, partial [Clostridia bacterium]|nr:hypothetical protein [Clostridia bacterium]